jgi:hypothetical protein
VINEIRQVVGFEQPGQRDAGWASFFFSAKLAKNQSLPPVSVPRRRPGWVAPVVVLNRA